MNPTSTPQPPQPATVREVAQLHLLPQWCHPSLEELTVFLSDPSLSLAPLFPQRWPCRTRVEHVSYPPGTSVLGHSESVLGSRSHHMACPVPCFPGM